MTDPIPIPIGSHIHRDGRDWTVVELIGCWLGGVVSWVAQITDGDDRTLSVDVANVTLDE